MDYEVTKVTLEMTAPEFEAVFGVLQQFTQAFQAGAFDKLPIAERVRIKDTVLTIKKLNFQFSEESNGTGQSSD